MKMQSQTMSVRKIINHLYQFILKPLPMYIGIKKTPQ